MGNDARLSTLRDTLARVDAAHELTRTALDALEAMRPHVEVRDLIMTSDGLPHDPVLRDLTMAAGALAGARTRLAARLQKLELQERRRRGVYA